MMMNYGLDTHPFVHSHSHWHHHHRRRHLYPSFCPAAAAAAAAIACHHHHHHCRRRYHRRQETAPNPRLAVPLRDLLGTHLGIQQHSVVVVGLWCFLVKGMMMAVGGVEVTILETSMMMTTTRRTRFRFALLLKLKPPLIDDRPHYHEQQRYQQEPSSLPAGARYQTMIMIPLKDLLLPPPILLPCLLP
jgi:hypothetical protein